MINGSEIHIIKLGTSLFFITGKSTFKMQIEQEMLQIEFITDT